MSPKVRLVTGAAAVALLIWMIVLFTVSSSVTARQTDDGKPAVTYECDPIAPYLFSGYTSNGLAYTGGFLPSFEIADGSSLQWTDKTVGSLQAVNEVCAGRRTAYAALIGLLAVPTAVFASLCLRRRPTRIFRLIEDPTAPTAPAVDGDVARIQQV